MPGVRVRCFESLVAGDGNSRADAFTRKLPAGKLKRIKAPAGVSEVTVSGDCRSFALVAGGSLYVKRGNGKLRKLAQGGVRSPGLTYNGAQVGYARHGKVLVRRVGGRGRAIADTNLALRSIGVDRGGVLVRGRSGVPLLPRRQVGALTADGR